MVVEDIWTHTMVAKVRKTVVEVAKVCTVVAGVAKARKTVVEKVVEAIAVLMVSRRAIAMTEFVAKSV